MNNKSSIFNPVPAKLLFSSGSFSKSYNS
ncbi:uncharacterized protein METZ01_LOCUS411343, partial [marine metagenome]